MAGRPRKPTALKLVEGNRGKRALPANEPRPRPVRPDTPEYLSDVGLAKWRDLAGKLEDIGVLTEVDGDVLGLYCYAFERFVRADEVLLVEGRETSNAAGSPILSPWVTEMNTAVADMRKFGAELGIGAASRSRIEVRKHDDSAEDPTAKAIAVAAARK